MKGNKISHAVAVEESERHETLFGVRQAMRFFVVSRYDMQAINGCHVRDEQVRV